MLVLFDVGIGVVVVLGYTYASYLVDVVAVIAVMFVHVLMNMLLLLVLLLFSVCCCLYYCCYYGCCCCRCCYHYCLCC